MLTNDQIILIISLSFISIVFLILAYIYHIQTHAHVGIQTAQATVYVADKNYAAQIEIAKINVRVQNV
jgi:hypothetical protein